MFESLLRYYFYFVKKHCHKCKFLVCNQTSSRDFVTCSDVGRLPTL
eukprot:UN17651